MAWGSPLTRFGVAVAEHVRRWLLSASRSAALARLGCSSFLLLGGEFAGTARALDSMQHPRLARGGACQRLLLDSWP